MPINKLPNQYQQAISFYEKCPKAVWAAIAVSFAQRIFGEDAAIEKAILEEWNTLNQNGIVPQKAPAA